jgi:glucose-1-phosphate cytidylyltransferase
MEVHQQNAEPWRVTLVDTGQDSMTGGRIKRVSRYLDNEPFLLTYGDGVADVDIAALVDFHKQHGRQATVTSVQPMGRFGALDMTGDNRVLGFQEKPKGDGSWVNGGFFVLDPAVLDRIIDDETVFEKEPLEGLASDGQLVAYKHDGFWQAMDTLRDKNHLEELWAAGAPWRVW